MDIVLKLLMSGIELLYSLIYANGAAQQSWPPDQPQLMLLELTLIPLTLVAGAGLDIATLRITTFVYSPYIVQIAMVLANSVSTPNIVNTSKIMTMIVIPSMPFLKISLQHLPTVSPWVIWSLSVVILTMTSFPNHYQLFPSTGTTQLAFQSS